MLKFLPLAAVPASAALRFWLGGSSILVFVSAALGVAVLAQQISEATEAVAGRAGPGIGGVLNVSLGSVADLVLAFFVLAAGHADVVRSQITGSIISTALFGLGLAIVLGGLGRERLRFKRERGRLLSSLLLVALIALLQPVVFDFALRHRGQPGVEASDEKLSLALSVVLLLLYVGNLVYTLVTHRDLFSRGNGGGSDGGDGGGSLWRPVAVLVAATVAVTGEAELVSGALEATAQRLGLSSLFLGASVLALVGSAPDIVAAVRAARRDALGLALDICVGSAIQVVMVVAPLLVLGSFLLGKPMTLVFDNPLDLFAIAATALIVNTTEGDGETMWFEGGLLIGVYLLVVLSFFHAG